MSSSLRRIMLVEDDPDIATLVTIALKDFGGYELAHFRSAEDALAGVAAVNPDLALLDFSLPGMTGGDLLQQLRGSAETAHIPAVFMTASVMPANVQKLLELGALKVIAKPFDPLTLASQLAAVWDEHQQRTAAG